MKLTEKERSLLYNTCIECGQKLYEARTNFAKMQEGELKGLSKDERKLLYYACTKRGDDLLEADLKTEAIEYYAIAFRLISEDTE